MAVQGLLDFIGGIEAPGGYRTAYGGSQMPEGLTLEQTIDWARKHGQKTGSSAVGRYQFLSGNLEKLANETGTHLSTPFTPAIQDQFAVQLLKRRGLDDYYSGKLSPDAFAKNLAMEWAAIPYGPENRSYYESVMGNKAGATWKETLANLPDVRMAGGTPSQMAAGDPATGRMNPQQAPKMQLPPFPQMATQAPQGPQQSLMNPLIALVAGLASGGGNFRANLGNAGAASSALQSAENDLYELRTKREDATRKRNQTDSLSKWFSQMAETPGLEDVGAMGMADPGAGMQLYAAKQKAQQEAAQREQAARTLEQQGRPQDAALVRSGAALGSVSNQVQASNEYYAPIPIAGPDNSTIYRQFSKGGGFVDYDGQGRPLTRDPKAERELSKQRAAGTFEGTQGAKEQLRQEKLGPVLDEIGEKIKQSTGSGIGAMIDSAARWFGVSTPGSLAIAELEPLAARLMLAGERLEGPQSDADRIDLKAAAGNIANPSIPADQRQRSFDVIKRLSKKYNLDEVDAGAPAATAPSAAPQSPSGTDPLGWRK